MAKSEKGKRPYTNNMEKRLKITTNLSDLACPTILLILKNLDALSLLAVAGTSRRMRTLAKDYSLWKDVVIEIPDKLHRSRHSPGPSGYRNAPRKPDKVLDVIVGNYLSFETRSLHVRPFGGKEHLEVSWQDPGEEEYLRLLARDGLNNEFPETAPVFEVRAKFLAKVGQASPNLEALTLTDCRMGIIDDSTIYGDEEDDDEEELEELVKPKFANLKTLTLERCVAGGEWKEEETGSLWVKWVALCNSMAPTLRTLRFLNCFDEELGVFKNQFCFGVEMSDMK